MLAELPWGVSLLIGLAILIALAAIWAWIAPKWHRGVLREELGREPSDEEIAERTADSFAESGWDKRKCLFCGKRLKPKTGSWIGVPGRQQVCRACGRAQPQKGWGRTHRLVEGELIPKDPAPPNGESEEPAPVEVPTDLAAQLEKLHELHGAGALSADEFAAAKERILGSGMGKAPAVSAEAQASLEMESGESLRGDPTESGSPPPSKKSGSRLWVAAFVVAAAGLLIAVAAEVFNTLRSPTLVPEVRGLSLDIARAEIEDAGLDVRISGGGVFGVVVESNWEVCSQEPPSGTEEAGSGTVAVDRPGFCPTTEEATVPDVEGLTLDVAEQAIESAGLRVEVLGGGVFGVVVESNWEVCSQDPAPGTETTDEVTVRVKRVGLCR